MAQTEMVAGGRLTDWISLGVLTSWVPADAVDDAVEVTGKRAQRRGGKLPPRVVAYLVMAMALFADEDYEEVAARLAGTLGDWGGWEESWGRVPTSGGITQARQRLGPEPMAELFGRVAVPVAGLDTGGAFLGNWRLMSIDGMEWDVPDTAANREGFGARGGGEAAYPRVRVVTVSECASHAPVLAAMGAAGAGKGTGEQSLAKDLYPRLEEGWLVIADRGFFTWDAWRAAAGSGADLLWRVKSDLRLPVLELLPDGSYRSVLIWPGATFGQRQALIGAARRGDDLDPDRARLVRVIEYDVPDREGDGKGELIALVTTIADRRRAPAAVLAAAYHERWAHETGNAQLKTYLRGPGRVLRSASPDMVRQEIWGYLLTHYAISALICTAATAAGIDPDRVKFKRAVRVIRRRVADPAFSP